MGDHKKKMIAPVIITILVVAYFAIYFTAIIHLVEGPAKYLLAILPPVMIYAMIKMCIERINEIKEGETDDLSKY